MPLQVRLRKSYARKAGYSRYSGLGKLIKPVENQEGRWYVKFVNLGETFLSVGRHGVHELAYVDVAPLNKLKEKKDLVEPGKDEDDTSVCRSPPTPAPPSPRKPGVVFDHTSIATSIATAGLFVTALRALGIHSRVHDEIRMWNSRSKDLLTSLIESLNPQL